MSNYVHYYVYDNTTGEILSTGTCTVGDMPLQARKSNESVIVGDQNVIIAMRLASQADEAPTHKIDISGKKPVIMVKPEAERTAFITAETARVAALNAADTVKV